MMCPNDYTLNQCEKQLKLMASTAAKKREGERLVQTVLGNNSAMPVSTALLCIWIRG